MGRALRRAGRDRFVARPRRAGADPHVRTRRPGAPGGGARLIPLDNLHAYDRHTFGSADHEARQHPSISPLYADLSGLCPALFTVGTADPLLDDSVFMAARWEAAGNEAHLDVYPECAHGFPVMPIELGRQAADRILSWLDDIISR